MFDVREATETETATWRAGWAARLRARYRRCYRADAAVTQEVDRNLATQHDDPGSKVYAVEVDGVLAGHLALSGSRPRRPDDRTLHDLWLAPEHRGRGLGRALTTWARAAAAADGGARLSVATVPGDPVCDALFGAYPLRAQLMVKDVTGDVVLPAGVTGRPMAAAEFGPWRDNEVRGYADELAASGSLTPEQAWARSVTEIDGLLPDGLGTAGDSFWCVADGATVVGMIWLRHAFLPGLAFVFGVEVEPAHRGRGYGRAAMLVGERATAAAGETQLGLNVFGHNTVALRLYDSLGYRIVEQYRSDDL